MSKTLAFLPLLFTFLILLQITPKYIFVVNSFYFQNDIISYLNSDKNKILFTTFFNINKLENQSNGKMRSIRGNLGGGGVCYVAHHIRGLFKKKVHRINEHS